MNKKKIGIIGAILILISASGSGVFGFSMNIENTTLNITISSDDFEFETVYINNEAFTSVELDGYGFSRIEGQPKLPMIRKMIEIPQSCIPELMVISESWENILLEELNLNNKIIPVQPSVEKIPEPYNKFIIDDYYYSNNEFMPEKLADIVEIGEIRSRRFALVEISPVQYNPVSGEVKLLKNCEIKIKLPNSDLKKTYENIKRYSTESFEKLFELTFDNYGAYEKGITSKDSEGYLIIVYEDFYDEIEPLSDWKTDMGYNTTVTKTSDIPGGASKEKIHDYIVDAYNNWDTPPAYILLVGDIAQVPTYTGTEGPDAVDLYYVTINSGDYLPDIFIGRFPASTDSEVTAMVDKTIYYEEANFSDIEWIKKAAFMAGNDNYDITEGTHNYVISNYLEPNGYTCDKIYEVTYGGDTQDVKDALNDGRSLAIFSGHGSIYSWGDGPPFSQSDVRSLTNEGMYPFVCSHSCLTGSFQVSECFGETWLREQDKGGIAFWGASESTFWDEDDILQKGMFQAWWDDGLESIGGMTDMALYYVYENYSGGGSSKYYFEAYNILGDPSIKIWRTEPSDPPETPSTPDGPSDGAVGYDYTFSSSTTEPDEDEIFFMWDWGDGEFSSWIGPYSSGDMCYASHSWNNNGSFEVRVKARDNYFTQSDWSQPSTIEIVHNDPPDIPEINGPYWLIPKISYNFKFSSIEHDDEDIYFLIEWGDGDTEEWIGPYSSGEEVKLSHKYTIKGNYKINVTAKDINGFESETKQKQIKVSFSRDRTIKNPLLSFIFERLFEKYRFIGSFF
jgi:hypothetical protein